jgi:uncharacterized membrane protein YeaQ/YmgE (transglycosylase-associated protein family)
MDVLLRLLVQLLIALGCAGIATFLLPRRVPGKIFGLVVMGFAGVWLGEWALNFVKSNYGLSVAALEWSFQGVPILPSIIGSAVILYVVTAFLSWGRYNR